MKENTAKELILLFCFFIIFVKKLYNGIIWYSPADPFNNVVSFIQLPSAEVAVTEKCNF